jgi:MFS transporter, DHA1 family, inner membrane transport protein
MNSVHQDVRKREYMILLAIVIMMMVNQTAVVIISPLAVAIAEEFDTTVSVTGQLRTVAAMVSALLAPFIGLMSDRFGRRPIMLLGLLSITAFGFGSSVAPSFGMLLAIQTIAGFGIASLMSTSFAVAGDAFPAHRRAWAVGILSIGQPLAWMIGMPLIGLVADTASWRWSFVAVPMLFSLAGIAFVRWIPVPERSSGSAPSQATVLSGLGRVLRNRSARSWILAELLAYVGWTGTLVYLGAFYITEYGLSTAATGASLALAALGFATGSLMSHRAVTLLGPRLTIISGAGLSGLALAVALTTNPTLLLSLVLIVLFGMAQGVRGAASSVLGLSQSPEHQGTMMGFRASVVQLGYVLGGILGGVLLALGGYPLLGISFALLIAAAAVLTVTSVNYASSGP